MANWVGFSEKEGVLGIYEDVWNICCIRCTFGVVLQEVMWSEWYSLRAGWWSYPMLVLLFKRGWEMQRHNVYIFVRLQKKELLEHFSTVEWEVGYIGFGKAIEKGSTWRFWLRGGKGWVFIF